jgi:predicted PurR-regulated permease PerM
MALSRFSFYTLLLMLLMVGYLSFEVVRPFLSSFVWAVFLAVVFYPVYRWAARYTRSKRLGSVITTVLVVFVILGPFTLLLYLLLKEMSFLSTYLQNSKFEPKSLLDNHLVHSIVETIFPFLGLKESELASTARDSITALGKGAAGQIPKTAAGLFGAVFNFIFTIIILFILFVDGKEMLDRFLDYLPFSMKRRQKLKEEVKETVSSGIRGGLFTALTHGLLGSGAFAAVGLPSPLLLGLAVGITAFVPLVGSLMIWVPAILYLAFTEHINKAIVLLVVGGTGIMIIDNLLRPFLVRGGTKMPFLLIFFGVIGGLEFFGLMGLVLGPLVLAIFLSLVNFTKEIEDGQLRADNHQAREKGRD